MSASASTTLPASPPLCCLPVEQTVSMCGQPWSLGKLRAHTNSFFLQHNSKRALFRGCHTTQLATSSTVHSTSLPRHGKGTTPPLAVPYRISSTCLLPPLPPRFPPSTIGCLLWPIRVRKHGCRTPITKRLSNLRSPGLTADPSTTTPEASFCYVPSCCFSCRHGTQRSLDCDRRLASLLKTPRSSPCFEP